MPSTDEEVAANDAEGIPSAAAISVQTFLNGPWPALVIAEYITPS